MEKTNLREFVKYVALNVLGMAGLSCYILADTFFISKGLGARGLAALNLAIPVYSFIRGVGLMLGMGGAVRYSILRSRKEMKEADENFSQSLFTAVFFAGIFVAAGIFLSGSITGLLGADVEIFDMTDTYLRVLLLFAPAFIFNDIFICFVRNDGDPKLAMTAMLSGSFCNILLDYIFIFPLRMGIFGAVFATGLAPVISMGILSLHRIQKRNQFHLVKTRPRFGMIRKVVGLGVPSLITELSSGIVIIVFNMIILSLQGNIGVAAYGVVANLSLVVTAVFTGIAQGAQPLISRACGNGDRKELKQLLRWALTAVLLAAACVYLVVFLGADQITSIFNSAKDPLLQKIAVRGLKIYFTSAVFVGFNIVLSVYFMAADRPVPAQVVSVMRGFAVIVPMAFLMSAFLGLTGVWMAFPATEILVSLTAVGLYARISGKRENNRLK